MKRSLAPILLAAVVPAAATACHDDELAETASYHAPEPGADDPRAAVVLDLAAEHGHAESRFERDVLAIGSYDRRVHLTAGWAFPDVPDGGADDPEAVGLWADGKEAEVAFYLGEVAPRRARFLAHGYLPAGTLDLPVVVRLNGQPVAGLTLHADARPFDLALPPAAQRVGTNRLRFEFASIARPVYYGDGTDTRWFAGRFTSFHFELEDPAARARLELARELCPEGSRVTAGGAIEQASGSRIRYHLEVPPGAELVARLGFVRRRAGSTDAALFRVTARRDGAEPTALLEATVPWTEDGALVAVRAPLDDYAGELVALDLTLEPASGDDAVLGVWGAPRVVAPATRAVAEPPEPERAALAARERLRGAPVVVLLLDAFNPSFISAYGGRAGLTPALDAVAAEGVLFEQAFAQATYTLSSVGTMLTSRPATEHGVWSTKTSLRPGVETWAERFSAAGYRTAAIVCSVNGSSVYGFERGFESYSDVWLDYGADKATPAEESLPYFERVLAADDGRPLFLWMHVLEPHEPYDDSPPRYRGRFDAGYEGTISGDAATLSSIRDGLVVPTERDIERLKAQYEEGIAYVDEVVGRIRTTLAAAGLDDALLAIVSDHGEAFMEHRPKDRILISHGSTVFDEMARVPLLVRLPAGVAALGARGRRAGARVASSDLLPTLADLVGVAPPAESRGESFARLLFGAASYARDRITTHAYPATDERFVPALGLWTGGYKLIHRSGDGDELYVAGVREEHDLSAEMPVRTGWMRQELRRALGFDPDEGISLGAFQEAEVSVEAEDQLRALGYAR